MLISHLSFAKVSIKGERIGDWFVLLSAPPPSLWIDESPITLYQRVRFQRRGVNALSFSSRKRADQVRNDVASCHVSVF